MMTFLLPVCCAACRRPFAKGERRHGQYMVIEAELLLVHVHDARSCRAFLDPWFWQRRRAAC
jgi:hypothetical protein